MLYKLKLQLKRLFLLSTFSWLLSISNVFILFISIPVNTNSSLYSQEYDDDEDDGYEEEIIEKKKSEIKKKETKKYIDDEEEDENEEEFKVIKTKKQAKEEVKVKKDIIKKNKESKEVIDANYEKRLRNAKKLEANRRKLLKSERILRRKKKILYAKYYEDYMKKNKVFSKVSSRLGFAVAVTLGFHPNLGNSVHEGFTFGSHLQSSRASEYLNNK